MRNLASIQQIWKIEPIEGADRIELAHVLGWQCVVNKNQFKVNDLAIYFEIDSFLPIKPEFEFLRTSSYKKTDLMGEGFRLKTMKFRGQISQGLLLPISAFNELSGNETIGTDVTEILGVRKWEIEEMATTGGTVIGTLPYDVPHTDETRIQANPELLNEFANLEYYITTKMDGSSHSLSIDKNGFHVTGHNYEYKDDGVSSFYNLVKQNKYEEKMRNYFESHQLSSFTIQGEFCGPGIQRNRLKLFKPQWYVFTIRINGLRIGLVEMQSICKELELDMVPVQEIGFDLPSKYPTIESLLERANGNYPNGGKQEGIVIRPTIPVYSKTLSENLSMKVINNNYLLKNED